eukprot:6209499-Pleurochrysis_carterae.AAC.3
MGRSPAAYRANLSARARAMRAFMCDGASALFDWGGIAPMLKWRRRGVRGDRSGRARVRLRAMVSSGGVALLASPALDLVVRIESALPRELLKFDARSFVAMIHVLT